MRGLFSTSALLLAPSSLAYSLSAPGTAAAASTCRANGVFARIGSLNNERTGITSWAENEAFYKRFGEGPPQGPVPGTSPMAMLAAQRGSVPAGAFGPAPVAGSRAPPNRSERMAAERMAAQYSRPPPGIAAGLGAMLGRKVPTYQQPPEQYQQPPEQYQQPPPQYQQPPPPYQAPPPPYQAPGPPGRGDWQASVEQATREVAIGARELADAAGLTRGAVSSGDTRQLEKLMEQQNGLLRQLVSEVRNTNRLLETGEDGSYM